MHVCGPSLWDDDNNDFHSYGASVSLIRYSAKAGSSADV